MDKNSLSKSQNSTSHKKNNPISPFSLFMEDSSLATTTKEPQNTVTLSRKAQKDPDMDSSAAGQEPLAVVCRARLQERRRRSRRSKESNSGKKVPPTKEDVSSKTDDQEDEKAEVENKIMALKKIVPGGESLGVDKLFEETAGYILELQYQVEALKFLASFVEGSDKETRKFGG